MEKKMITGFNELCREHHYAMREKGFWSLEDAVSDMADAHPELFKDDEELQLHNTMLTSRLALISTEIGEAIDALRENKHGYGVKDTFEDELADVILRLMDLIGGLDIDIESQLRWKANYNKSRGYRHGKLF
jgi:NTP pyrophosphatase (non-canonical NTP hydrolase)